MAFTYKGEQFYLNDDPFTVRAGAIHYFRVPRAYWHDRLRKLKECGFNTVETYVPWNYCEQKEGTFDFSGEKDIAAFLRTAQQLGLYAVVRPGPFICAEWEAGGLPAFAAADAKIRLRCDCDMYMQKVERYLQRLFAELRPCLLDNGGNILMMQVENEYGSYGNDKAYLHRLADWYRACGITCVLFTADGVCRNMVVSGSLPEKCLPFLTFGSHTEQAMRSIEYAAKNTPKMCAEFWCGWFDHWGEEHHTRTAEEVLCDFEPFLRHNWNFNFYMFHGGTNFGFTNGANYENGKYMPVVTSYDYCAPLNEAGDRTETYYKLRETIVKYGVPVPELTARESKKAAYGTVELKERAYLFDNLSVLSAPVRSPYPLYSEECGQSEGYTLYRAVVPAGMERENLFIDGLADRGVAYVNGEKLAVFDRNLPAPDDVFVQSLDGEKRLDILVENRGRINYGREICDRKGLRCVRLSYAALYGWEMYPLDMHDVSGLTFENVCAERTEQPVFCAASFSVQEPCDTFVEIVGANSGFVEVNGHNIGRFNNDEGPQKALYVPAPYLKSGENRIVVFCFSGVSAQAVARFTDTPILG